MWLGAIAAYVRASMRELAQALCLHGLTKVRCAKFSTRPRAEFMSRRRLWNRVWLRRLVIAAACLPLAAASVLHTMGRSGDFGLLGKW